MTAWEFRDAWNFKDLTGLVFGQLTVISRSENHKNGASRWNCRCDCGAEKTFLARNLHSGGSHSCGWGCTLRSASANVQQRLRCVTHDITCNPGAMAGHSRKNNGSCEIVRLECSSVDDVIVDPEPGMIIVTTRTTQVDPPGPVNGSDPGTGNPSSGPS